MDDLKKARFAFKCFCKSLVQSPDCPYCASRGTKLVGRKRVVLQLRKCGRCGIQFRFPKDGWSENKRFYQSGYRESSVTDLPSASDMSRHIANNFREIGRDITEHLKTVQSIAPARGERLLDYGSSWGYCVHQFNEAGYTASGFEISRERVEYGRKMLGVELSDSISSFPDASFDVIYSAHCLEHIPSPEASFNQFRRLLRTGGHLFIYVPNCGGAEARRLGVGWGPMIGEKHVLALTAEFFYANLPRYGFQLQFSSSPYSSPPQPYTTAALEGEELLVVGVRNMM